MFSPLESAFRRTYQDNRVHLDALVRRMVQEPGTIFPFVGAGFSMPTGMPGWEKFIHSLVDIGSRNGYLRPTYRYAIEEHLLNNEFENAADYLWTNLGDGTFTTHLQNEFRLNGRPIRGAVRWIPGLATTLIITTNFDQILEITWNEYLKSRGISEPCTPLMAKYTDDLKRMRRDAGRWVLKLHGDVDKVDSWIIRNQHYVDAYKSDSLLRIVLKNIFDTRTPLFLGCSLKDYRILDVLKDLGSMAFAVLAQKAPDEEQKMVSEFRDVINIIWLREDDAGVGGNHYDILDPLLEWIVRRIRLGPVQLTVPQRAQHWDGVLSGFKYNGEYSAAIDWIKLVWPQHKSWSLGIRLLEFYDLLGDGSGGVDDFFEISEGLKYSLQQMHDEPWMEHAERYYRGRLQGHKGLIDQAKLEHVNNIKAGGVLELFQILNCFEIGQLLYRLEEYEEAFAHFSDIWSLGKELEAKPHLLVDVLKFLGTLQVRDVVLSMPGSPIYVDRGKAEMALEYAELAKTYAEDSRYYDGTAWAHAIRAFALEGLGRQSDVCDAYESALSLAGDSRCRRSSQTHIRVYLACFLRRCKKPNEALLQLEIAESHIPSETRYRDFAKIEEERSNVAWMQGYKQGARKHLRKALALYHKDPFFRYSDGCAFIARLKECCNKMHVRFKA